LVTNDPKYVSWKADFSPESLLQLGEWMVESIQTRPMTVEEIDYIKSTLSFKVDFAKWTFTDFSLSIIYDVSIYFSTIFTKKYDGITWATGTRKRADGFGKPVLNGFGSRYKLYLSPPDIIEVCAMKMARKEPQSSEILFETFEVWRGYISGHS
jgi:hypothetical protein